MGRSRHGRCATLRAGVAAFVALLALVAPATASAGAAGVVTSFDAALPGSGQTAQRSDTFAYIGSPFEVNDVSVDVLPDAVVFSESLLTVTPGAGCEPAGLTAVRCPFPTVPAAQAAQRVVAVQGADGPDTITLRTLQRDDVGALLAGGAGNDVLSSAPARRSRPGNLVLAVLDGDDGDDVLTGGADREELVGDNGADQLHGGGGDDTLTGEERTLPRQPAPDVLDGGPGRDLLTYAGRRPLAVDLEDAGPDGRPGEGDQITGIEDVRGGGGPNTLLGDAGPNTLTVGGSGLQRVDGRAGDDRLTVLTDGELAGGPGNDRLLGDPSPSCGEGDDIASPVRAAAPDCERVPVYGEDVAVQLQPLRARARRVRLLFRAVRPDVPGRRSERLGGTAVVRRGTRLGRGRVLARGSMSVPRVQLPVTGVSRVLRLTRAGRALVADRRSHRVNVTLALGGQTTRYPVSLARAGR